MPKRSSKPQKDHQQIARHVLEVVAPDAGADESKRDKSGDGKNPAAVALGRRGGKKGGKARAARLTAKQRSQIAKKAAETRWKKKRD